MRVDVKPALLRWARERAGFELAALAKRFPHVADWERGDARATLKQLEQFAKTSKKYRFRISAPLPIVTSNVRARTCSTRSTSASSVRSGTATSRDPSVKIRCRSSDP